MRFLHKFKDGFIAFGDFLGTIMTTVILTILYFTVVLLVWLFGGLFRKRFIDKRLDTEGSYWVPVEDEEISLDKMSLPF